MRRHLLKITCFFIVAFVLIVFAQPGHFRVSRSATIHAPASLIFAQVNNQQHLMTWSPWGKLDPHAQFSYEGPEAGVGSILHWRGDSQLGEGASTIIESIPNTRVTMRLDLVKPMKGANRMAFSLRPVGAATEVTWMIEGENDFLGKATSLLMNCKQMVGERFEQGLGNLKALVEK